jgi:hypothetical protein
MPVPSPRLLRRRPDGLRGRIGVIAAAVALVVQLVVVFAPMPQGAGGGGLAALVSPHAGCELPAPVPGKPHHGPAPAAGHECPICQILAQTGSYLSPVVAEIAPPSWAPAVPTTPTGPDRPTRPAPSQAQPRAPPSLT